MSMRVYVRTHIHTCRWLSYPHDMYTQTHCHTYSRLSKSIGIVRCMCPEIGKEKIVASNAVETYILWTWNALLAANKWRMLSLHASIFNCVCSTDKTPRSIKSTVWQIYSFEWIWFEMTCVSLYDILLCWPFSRRLSLSLCLSSQILLLCVQLLFVWFVIHPFYLFPYVVRWVANAWKKSTSTDFQDHYRVKRKFEFVFYLLRIWIFFLNV